MTNKLRFNNRFIIFLVFIPIIYLVIFYFTPLIFIISISIERGEQSFFKIFFDAVSSPGIIKVIRFTVFQATISTIITLIVGLPGAYAFAKYDFPGKSIIRAISGVPFVMPTIVIGAGFSALLGTQGILNRILMYIFNLNHPPLEILYTLPAIIIAHVFYNTTIVLRLVGDFWSRISPEIDNAAKILGANWAQRFWHVTLPMLTPAIITAALLIFIFDFTSFGVILILGGPRFATIEVEIYYQTISLFNLQVAAALSIVQLTITLAITIVYTKLSASLSRPLKLMPNVHTARKPTTLREILTIGIILVFILLLSIAPLLSTVVRSFTSLTHAETFGSGFTLEYYKSLTQISRESISYIKPSSSMLISLSYALITVILSLLLGIPTAFVLTYRNKLNVSKYLDPILMLPLGTSAVTLGLGYLVTFNKPPLNLRASPILIPIAHTLVAFPFVVRSLVPALRSIQPQIRQAAQVLGAPPLVVFKAIDLPIVGKAILVASVFAFNISLGEFGATALLTRPEYTTMPVLIYRFLSRPGSLNYGQAMALSTILIFAVFSGIVLIERFRIAEIGEF